ncbi:MAG: valine--tRNA ligase [Immundisolibacterales bacterium]|nr:valine--tRNA ligase [Immundisolibacterales bacterium]
METTYDPRRVESGAYAAWEAGGRFAPNGEGRRYCIMIPPPNVTGTLHMGHAFQDTIMDTLIRFHRMRGRDTLWQMGTDHAGIATQVVVERQLEAAGEDRRAIGRDAFVERVWDWTRQSGETIRRQLRRLGASVDWSTERFTLDEGLSEAVLETFVRLYDKGLVYRGRRLVNWDPVLRTAVSDLEVKSEEEDGHLWHIRYPLCDSPAGGPEWVVVATTRPETMLGDVAVAVHPDDPRYADLVGRRVELPLAGRTIPIVADESVVPEFGTGCLKITPAHDFNDYEVGERHGLPSIDIFTETAHLNERAPAPYRGLDRFVARERIVTDLRNADRLDRVESYRHQIPRGERTGAVVEPRLTAQWFVRAGPLAEPAIRAVESGRVRFVPENWAKVYYQWMHDIEDWCISRQIWWGHRIPAWYDREGGIFVGRSEEEVRARHGLGPEVPLERDSDVLDTWFSSALWPFSTLGWPRESERLDRYYPTSVLVTGFDIIFFWVARMIMMGVEFMDEVPFDDVYIHGLVLDENGDKMSKSKGNILDPLDLIDGVDLESLVAKRTTGLMRPEDAPHIAKATRRQFPDGIPAYGTDALRFTFCALATNGRNIRFDLKRIEGYRNFCNKLWNAARYVLRSVDPDGAGTGRPAEAARSAEAERGASGVPGPQAMPSVVDRWIRSRLVTVAEQVRDGFESYRFDYVASSLYDFTWNEFCDWYVELTKPILAAPGVPEAARSATRRTLVEVFETLLRFLHPIMPFVTEDLWLRVAPAAGIEGETVMLQPWPEPGDADPEAETEVEWIKGFVLAVRNARGEMDIAPGRRIGVRLQGGDARDAQRVAEHRTLLESLARLEGFTWLEPDAPNPPGAAAFAGALKILLPFEGTVDLAAERARLEREIAKRVRDLGQVEAKLANEAFVARAPAPVVEKQRERAAELGKAVGRLQDQVERLAEAG